MHQSGDLEIRSSSRPDTLEMSVSKNELGNDERTRSLNSFADCYCGSISLMPKRSMNSPSNRRASSTRPSSTRTGTARIIRSVVANRIVCSISASPQPGIMFASGLTGGMSCSYPAGVRPLKYLHEATTRSKASAPLRALPTALRRSRKLPGGSMPLRIASTCSSSEHRRAHKPWQAISAEGRSSAVAALILRSVLSSVSTESWSS